MTNDLIFAMIITREIMQVLLFSSFMAAAAGRTKLITRSLYMRTVHYSIPVQQIHAGAALTANYAFDQSDIGDLKSGSLARINMSVVYSFQALWLVYIWNVNRRHLFSCIEERLADCNDTKLV